MREKACVLNFEKNTVWVTPLISDTCINCNRQSCAKRGTPFQATNPRKLELSCGDIVQIGSSPKAAALQGIFSLLVPVAAATAGYFLADPAAQLLQKTVTEGMRAAGVLGLLLLSTGIVFLLTRGRLNLTKPEIISVLNGSRQLSNTPSPEC
ncbi:SoxR reducing system RseC family protein [Treponema brennaborense]|uniref:Positive regulator of sigma E, RseC/MucC n=1 Tax=Treponema brennaborense (strain DSM 12168 / CIP 105900 / DD5/3) TaxID=906968 RepID=F4LIC2_TREBD|nr:SoxR reducing system RseC family protein [Treponema brennaborense]AEE16163.1 hypothetical protein Trebr_0721 [Treponema brennaborense DSM 12168]